jgi:hypothetical protein
MRVSGFASRLPLLLASDVRAVYGILTADGHYLYTTYDSPAQSYRFDLAADPDAEHNILTAPLKQRYDYDEEMIEQPPIDWRLLWRQAWSGYNLEWSRGWRVRARTFTAALVCCAVDVAAVCRRELRKTRHSAFRVQLLGTHGGDLGR